MPFSDWGRFLRTHTRLNSLLPALLLSLSLVSACGGGSSDDTSADTSANATIPTSTDAGLSLTGYDDSGPGDNLAGLKATCNSVDGWEYALEVIDAFGATTYSGECTATSMTFDPYVAHTVSLYQRAATTTARSAALEGDGWTLVQTTEIPPAMSGCTVYAANGQNTVVCYDEREETTFRVCHATSAFSSTTDEGVTCEDFTREPGAPIRWTHSGLDNGTPYYYSVMAITGAGGLGVSLPSSQSGAVTPNPVGCTDSTASNYDSGAVINDGSCTYTVADNSSGGSGGSTALTCAAGMVKFTGGTFTMGWDGDAYTDNDEHTVTLSDFCIDAKEVTQAQHQAWGADTTWTAYGFDADARCGGARATCPAEQVDWTNAQAYCVAQGKRLPTEAEWEYAARNGGTAAVSVYATGAAAVPVDCTDANYDSCNGGGATIAVGSYAASGSGLFDMAGNVWEWTGDWYANNYYANGQVNPTGPAGGTVRVVRGGSWGNSVGRLRASIRLSTSPTSRDNGGGFRCASNAP